MIHLVRQAHIKMPLRPSKRWMRSKYPRLLIKYCGLSGINLLAPNEREIGYDGKDFWKGKITMRIRQELKHTVENN